MTYDDETLMAYADGELGPIDRKRIEQAMAADAGLAARVAGFSALGDRVRGAFAPIANAPVPAPLAALLTMNIAAIAPGRPRRSWGTAVAVAASLILGLGLGTRWNSAPPASVAVRDGALVAAGPLAHALDTQLASTTGDVRMLVSFRSANGYCRVFASAIADGIACRQGKAWQLRQTRSGSPASSHDYRQAGSTDAALMAAAQDLMHGAPLDAADEARARAAGWE